MQVLTDKCHTVSYSCVAYLYKQPKSPYWWVSYRGADGRRKRESLKLRRDNKVETKKARTECLLLAANENQTSDYQHDGEWDSWVPSYIKRRYTVTSSFRCTVTIWMRIKDFLEANHKPCPAVICKRTIARLIQHLRGMGLRDSYVKAHVSKFSVIMKEAVRQGLCLDNPCLGWEFTVVKMRADKEPVSDEDIKTCLSLLNLEPVWMKVAFKVGLYHGVRVGEMLPDPSMIDLKRGTVAFLMKGNRLNVVPIHPEVKKELEWLVKEGKPSINPHTYQARMNNFFRKNGMPYSSHCLRVTCITRMAKAGVPIQHAMAYVNHASATIHRIYVRLQAKDLSHVHSSVSYDLQV